MKTDSQLQSDVQAELKWEPSVNATHIGVGLAPGEDGVYLTELIARLVPEPALPPPMTRTSRSMAVSLQNVRLRDELPL